MAEADPVYTPVFVDLLFLKGDKTAAKAAGSLKPDQLVRLDFLWMLSCWK